MVTPSRNDRAGRVRHAARLFGVKLPATKGRKPRLAGDNKDRFWRDINAFHNRNAARLAVEAVLDLVACYRDRLTPRERRFVARVAAKALAGKVRQ